MSRSWIADFRETNPVGRRLWNRQARASRSLYTRFRRGRSFTFQGKSLQYLRVAYNYTWRNERAVEIPIFQDIVAQYEPSQILEIGNVLRHYMPIRHDVVDKYEEGPDVQNVDAVDYDPGRTYDLIISISTLEHVGWDEVPVEPAKVRYAIDHLRQLLSPGGKLIVSLPVGYNSEVNTILAKGDVPWTSLVCLKRARWDNVWHQAEWRAIVKKRYDYWTPTARAIVIGTVGRAG
jgi:SAM-dependent methyltransferase